MENREAWLTEASETLTEHITLQSGLKPSPVKVSCGWPSTRALSLKKKTIGECWHHSIIEQEDSHIFISPSLSDPIEVLGVLLHELGHAALPSGTGHKAPFKQFASEVGLQGKPTATIVSEDSSDPLRIYLDRLASKLGEYPHQSIDKSLKPKQSTRLRLYECLCPIKLRVAKDDLHASCQDCESDFIQQVKEGE